MDFVVLVAPFLIILTIIIGLICICFKRIWIGLLIIIIGLSYNFYIEAIPFNVFTNKERGSFRILSYNMYSASEYFQSVEQNPKDMYEMLIAEDPDVIVLEEYYPDRCRAIRDSLLKHYKYFEFQQSITYSSNAVFSKYPLSEWKELRLKPESGTVEDKLLSRANELDDLRQKMEPRSVSNVKILLPNDSVYLIACHLASNHFDQIRETFSNAITTTEKLKKIHNCYKAGILEREAEVGRIMKEVEELNRESQKVVVIGDMNDVAGSKTLKMLQRDNILVNGWWKKGMGLGFTFHNHKIMHFRLDHVLYNRFIKLKNVRVIEKEYSDHRPLVADFE